MNEKQLHIIRHALGLNRSTVSYRNHYCAGGEDVALCRELVALGYMVERKPSELSGGSPVFQVTEAGKVAEEESLITPERTA